MAMPQPERFIADEMLGRLAKWLRLFGADAEYYPHVEDSALLRRCLDDPGRKLLTRDTELIRRRPVARGEIDALLVRSDDVRTQLLEIVEWAGIQPAEARCSICNRELARRDKAEVKSKVPPYVYETQETFRQCPRCGRVYWRATHWRGIERMRRDMAANGS